MKLISIDSVEIHFGKPLKEGDEKALFVHVFLSTGNEGETTGFGVRVCVPVQWTPETTIDSAKAEGLRNARAHLKAALDADEATWRALADKACFPA